MALIKFLQRQWLWLIYIAVMIALFRLQAAYEKPTGAVGALWLGGYLGVLALVWVVRSANARRNALREDQEVAMMTGGYSVPPVMFQMQLQAHRADKAVRTEYPDDVERVVLFGGYDGKVDELQSVVFLKGPIGEKLAEPFPGDPSGAWMLTDAEREKLSRIRSIIWSYAMAIGDAHFKPPVIFDSANRMK